MNNGEIVLGLSAHFFNWEALPLAFKVAVDPRVETVYLKVNNPFFEKLMRIIRKRFGGYLVERANFQRHFLKHRKTPRLIGLAADQRPSRQETRYWTPFMNKKTSFFEGPEKLAKRFGLSLFFSKVHKPKRGYYEYTLYPLGQPPFSEKDHSITDRFIQLVEQNIKEEPPLYLWSHNRWKNSP
ncbi:lysophospholipid acyltransferase family protein [Echinicola jeungdonensis]|uniref:lysophospholipid acyltransferase family protein n=1 Tax=Echinicola jeungdonensis TaxID=709343 RepID=UPI0025B3C59A|nr:lysophospholipid acyltransferase family protein [Echinicola jeungdonensis]MDN3668383.1 lysophospholipid acyltransferase family protein [Echinicola jeungdonensis]